MPAPDPGLVCARKLDTCHPVAGASCRGFPGVPAGSPRLSANFGLPVRVAGRAKAWRRPSQGATEETANTPMVSPDPLTPPAESGQKRLVDAGVWN